MARMTDKQRMLDAIPRDGAHIGNSALKALLNMREDRYWSVKDELVKDGLIASARGRGGGVYRIQNVSHTSPPTNVVGYKYSDENSLYEPFIQSIKDGFADQEDFQEHIIEQTAHQGSRNTHGIWTRPDVTLIGIRTYSYHPKTMEIITFELKHINGFNIAAVFETAAHTRFANRSFLAVYFPKDEGVFIDEELRKEVGLLCERFEIGLIFFKDPGDFNTFDFDVEAIWSQPDPAAQDDFIERQISSDSQKKLSRLVH